MPGCIKQKKQKDLGMRVGELQKLTKAKACCHNAGAFARGMLTGPKKKIKN